MENLTPFNFIQFEIYLEKLKVFLNQFKNILSKLYSLRLIDHQQKISKIKKTLFNKYITILLIHFKINEKQIIPKQKLIYLKFKKKRRNYSIRKKNSIKF